jgi:putative peptidoglycan lipid II flippase
MLSFLPASRLRLLLSLGVLSSLNLLFALLAQWYVVIVLGASSETDALLAGMAVPQLVLAVFSGSLTYVLVPLLAGESRERFQEDAWGFLWLVGGAFAALALILFVSAPLWVPLLFPGFPLDTRRLVTRLTRIQQLGMVLTALYGVLWAACQARQEFVRAELCALGGTATSFALLVGLLPGHGVETAAWLWLTRFAVPVVLLLSVLGPYRSPALLPATAREAGRRLAPLILGTMYYKTDPLVDRFLSSMTPPGGLSLLYLGQQIYSAAITIIDRTIAAPAVPLLAGHAKQGDWKAFRDLYRQRLRWVTALTVAGWAALLLAGRPILGLLIGRGGVTEQNVATLWWVMLCLFGVFVGGATGQILSTAFYAKGTTGTPTKIGAVGFTLGVGLKTAGFFAFGLPGIALGATAYYLLNVLALYAFLERELPLSGRPAPDASLIS